MLSNVNYEKRPDAGCCHRASSTVSFTPVSKMGKARGSSRTLQECNEARPMPVAKNSRDAGRESRQTERSPRPWLSGAGLSSAGEGSGLWPQTFTIWTIFEKPAKSKRLSAYGLDIGASPPARPSASSGARRKSWMRSRGPERGWALALAVAVGG